jgi:hypothetical protein
MMKKKRLLFCIPRNPVSSILVDYWCSVFVPIIWPNLERNDEVSPDGKGKKFPNFGKFISYVTLFPHFSGFLKHPAGRVSLPVNVFIILKLLSKKLMPLY